MDTTCAVVTVFFHTTSKLGINIICHFSSLSHEKHFLLSCGHMTKTMASRQTSLPFEQVSKNLGTEWTSFNRKEGRSKPILTNHHAGFLLCSES